MSVLVVLCYTGLITIVNHLYCYVVLSKRFDSYYNDVEDFEEVYTILHTIIKRVMVGGWL